jgi:cytochrome P450
VAVLLRLVGVPHGDVQRCRYWLRNSDGLADFRYYLTDLATLRARHPRPDLISDWLHSAGHGAEPVHPAEIARLVPAFVRAGHRPIEYLIVATIRLLLRRRGMWAAVATDRVLLTDTIEETLRIDPPVPFSSRSTAPTSRPVTINGVRIPAGDRILLVLASANHDPEMFGHPSVFDVHPDRSAAHMAFGHGSHFCAGASVARVTTRVAVQALAARLPDPAVLAAREPHHGLPLTSRRARPFRIRWTPPATSGRNRSG